jgi:hypothetical protein
MQNRIRTVQIQMRHYPICKRPKIRAHLKVLPSQIKMCQIRRQSADKPLPQKEKSINVLGVLFGGNHPANYKGCVVCKELQKRTPISPPDIHPPNLNQRNPIHQHRSNLRLNKPAELLRPHKCKRAKKSNATAKQRNTRIKKHHLNNSQDRT